MESVMALIPMDSPGNPKTIRKQDRKNMQYLFNDGSMTPSEDVD
jgi:hypothetical protein